VIEFDLIELGSKRLLRTGQVSFE